MVLVEPGTEVVPRGTTRQSLHDQGCIADLLEIAGDWGQVEVFQLLEKTFESILDNSRPSPR